MDKEIALIIAEMLIKQDETTEQVKEVATQVKEVITHVNGITIEVKETNSILRDFMGISVKQWEQQQTFNEVIITQLKEIKEVLSTLAQLDARLKAVEERESRFESRLANIEKLLKAS
jgi:hypothetical protein